MYSIVQFNWKTRGEIKLSTVDTYLEAIEEKRKWEAAEVRAHIAYLIGKA